MLKYTPILAEDLPDLASFRTQKSAVTEMGTIAVKVFRGIKQSEVTQSTEAYEKLDSETKFAKKLLEGKTLSHRIRYDWDLLGGMFSGRLTSIVTEKLREQRSTKYSKSS